MKKKIILSSLLFLFGMFMMPNVYAEEEVGSSGNLSTAISNAINGDGKVKLTGTVNVEDSTIEINTDKELTIDLNGNNIESTQLDKIFNIKKGTVKFTGSGKIVDKKSPSPAGIIYVYGSTTNDGSKTHLIIDKDVTVEGIVPVVVSHVSNANYGTTVDIYGKLNNTENTSPADPNALSVHGNITNGDVVINIHKGASLSSTYGVGLFQSGLATTTVEGSISGKGGVVIKSGTLNLENATVTATGEYASQESSGDGFKVSGSAIQVDSNGSYAGDVKININGGNITSSHGYLVEEYGEANNLSKVSLSGNPVLKSEKELFNGSVAKKVSLPEGEELQQNPDGTYTLVDPSKVHESVKEQPAEKNADTSDINLYLLITIIAASTCGLGYTFKKRFN